MLLELAQLTVNRDKKLGTHQVNKQLDLLLAGVTGDMHRRDRFIDDVSTALDQTVDCPVNILFITRDRVG